MLGAIIGDIVGSYYEFRHFKEKDFTPLFHPLAKFTDDTVCTIAVADALLNNLDPATTLRSWCRRYWQNGGWGQRFSLWIADDDMGPYGSWGNGGAMRVSAAGLLARDSDHALKLADQVTRITHDHPEGLRGAYATATAIHLARIGLSVSEVRENISRRFSYNLSRSVGDIRPGYRHSERSQDSVPEALTCAFEASDFEDAIRNAVSLGGDSDTMAAIAGSVAEALFGIEESIAFQGWGYLPDDMKAILKDLYAQQSIQKSF